MNYTDAKTFRLRKQLSLSSPFHHIPSARQHGAHKKPAAPKGYTRTKAAQKKRKAESVNQTGIHRFESFSRFPTLSLKQIPYHCLL
jgi:hypothetical protein